MEPLPESPLPDDMPSLAPIADSLPSVKEMIAMLEPPSSVVEQVASVADSVPFVNQAVESAKQVLSADQAALVKLVTDLVSKKPGTKEEALELFHKLQMHLGMWVVSELPGAEGKAMLAGLWAMEEMQKLNWKSCFGLK